MTSRTTTREGSARDPAPASPPPGRCHCGLTAGSGTAQLPTLELFSLAGLRAPLSIFIFPSLNPNPNKDTDRPFSAALTCGFGDFMG